MAENYTLILKRPCECGKDELELFLHLVINGKEVEKRGLSERITRAKILAFYYEKNTLVGIAALKQPDMSYKQNVFRKAGFLKKSGNYNLELGWVFVEKIHRGKRIGPLLVYSVIQTCQCNNIFSTTRTDNVCMQRILIKNGFKEIGQAYKGRNFKNFFYCVMLFVL